jgi:hypothetical protein
LETRLSRKLRDVVRTGSNVKLTAWPYLAFAERAR